MNEIEIRCFPLPKWINEISGEPNRFLVQSRSRPRDWHLVDLEENGFNGQCGCEVFQFKLFPKLREQEQSGKDERRKFRCYHITAAILYQGERAARIISREMNRPKKRSNDNDHHHD